jgi:hypothetical protein
MKTRKLFAGTARLLLSAALSLGLTTRPAYAGGGEVLPPTAQPSDYSLVDMAGALAYFSTSGNDLTYYPNTPFQVLYVNPQTGTNTFTVKAGTMFFVPVAFIDDSPPILGDFPTDASEVEDYVFSEEQLGAHDLAIVVDGQATSIGPEYVAGPVFALDLLDGGGAHYIQIGAFLSPLSKGKHTVTIRGTFDGAALGGFSDSFEISYTVIVQ